MDYNRQCGLLLDQFEIEFRSFISQQMAVNFGQSWWDTNVSGSIRSQCKKRQNDEEVKRFPRIQRTGDPIHYTNLGELKDIVCRHDNFTAVFQAYFGTVAHITTRVEEMIGYRNPAAHNRPVFGPAQYQNIISTCRSIFEAMDIGLPAEFLSVAEATEESVVEGTGIWVANPDDFDPRPKCTHNLPRPDYSDFFWS